MILPASAANGPLPGACRLTTGRTESACSDVAALRSALRATIEGTTGASMRSCSSGVACSVANANSGRIVPSGCSAERSRNDDTERATSGWPAASPRSERRVRVLRPTVGHEPFLRPPMSESPLGMTQAPSGESSHGDLVHRGEEASDRLGARAAHRQVPICSSGRRTRSGPMSGDPLGRGAISEDRSDSAGSWRAPSKGLED